MGHRMSYHIQDRRIADVLHDVSRYEHGTRAVVLIDYEMKFESIRFREKSFEFYGKGACSGTYVLIF